MNIILENIRKVLLEGRIEDVKKKYPEVDSTIIDYLVKEDPSGNNKYLEWLVKAMTHEPTIESIDDILDARMEFKPYEIFLMDLVRKFHELLPYMVYEEDGKKVGTTDLYQYKFTDTEMIQYLIHDLDAAVERKEKKEKEKNAKKNSDKIYDDGNWLVVRPKTWEASCVYGAGTRWCTTNKESDSHFKRETDRNFLIYVINKNKNSSDTLYKVAWQLPYSKNMSKKYGYRPGYEESTNIDLTSGIKLWNAQDTNIGNRLGLEYIRNIPDKVKNAIFTYMDFKMKEMYENMAYVEDPYMQALVENLAIPEEDVESIEELSWQHYGMKVFEYNSENYAVGTDEDVERAKFDWARQYVDDVGYENIGNIEDYVTIRYPRDIAADMASSYIEDFSDEDLIVEAKRLRNKKVNEMVEEFEVNSGIMETNQEEIDDMRERYDDLTEEEELELDELEKENESIEEDNRKLINSIRDAVESDYEDDMVDRLENDPLDWLWEMGYYNKKEGTFEKSTWSIADVDEDKIVDDMARNASIDDLSSSGDHTEINVEGVTYYVFSGV